MAGPTIKIKVDTGGLTHLEKMQARAKELKTTIKEADKEMSTLAKKGEKISTDLSKRHEAAQRDLALVERQMQAAKMRGKASPSSHIDGMTHGIGVQSPFRHAVSVGPVGINIREQVMSATNRMLQNAGLQKSLSNHLSADSMRLLSSEGIGGLVNQATSAALPYAAAAAVPAALPMAISWGQSITNAYSEEHRKSRADFSVKMADSRFTDPMERDLSIRKHKLEENSMDTMGRLAESHLAGMTGIGQIARLLNFSRNRNAGLDAYSTADKERQQAMRNSGFGADMERVSTQAELRTWAESYGSASVGFIAQNTWGKVKELWGSNEDAKEATAKVKEMFDRFANFARSGDTMAMNGDMVGAAAAYAAANKEISGTGIGWRDPLYIYTANQESTKAAKLYAISQNPLPPLRRGQG